MKNERHPSRKIGTKNRESAEAALVEHFVAERILRSEYDDKYRQVIAAETVDDLAAIFDGLPEPHPDLTPEKQTADEAEAQDKTNSGCGAQALGMAILWIGVPAGAGAWIASGQWWWLFAVAVVGAFLLWAGGRIGKTAHD